MTEPTPVFKKRWFRILILAFVIIVVGVLFHQADADEPWFSRAWHVFNNGDRAPAYQSPWLSHTIWTSLFLIGLFLLWEIPQTRNAIAEALKESGKKPIILIVGDAVVTYQFPKPTTVADALANMNLRGDVDARITEILTAHPNVDLRKHEEALGVKIIDVQRKGKDRPDPKIYV